MAACDNIKTVDFKATIPINIVCTYEVEIGFSSQTVCDYTFEVPAILGDISTQFINISLVRNGVTIVGEALEAYADLNQFFIDLGWTVDSDGVYHVNDSTDAYDTDVTISPFFTFEFTSPVTFPLTLTSVEVDGSLQSIAGSVNNFADLGTVLNNLTIPSGASANFNPSCSSNGVSTFFFSIYASFDHLIASDADGNNYDLRLSIFFDCSDTIGEIESTCESEQLPLEILSYVKNGNTVSVGETVTTQDELNTFFDDLGFTLQGTVDVISTYSITTSDDVYSRVSTISDGTATDFDFTTECIPTDPFIVKFFCNGVTFTSDVFNDPTDAIAWAQDHLGSFGTWTLDGTSIMVSGTTCDTGGLTVQLATTYDVSSDLPIDPSSYEADNFFTLRFTCNGSTTVSPVFSNGTDALQWAQSILGSYGIWTLDGNTLTVIVTSCSSATLTYTTGDAIVRGCTVDTALNWNPNANVDNGSCIFDPDTAPNYIDIICETYTVTTIEYSSGLYMDIYKETCNVNTDRPVWFSLHPGGGTRTEFTTVKMAREAAKRGYLGIAIDYGSDGTGGGATNARIDNVLDAIQYVIDNAVALGVNPNNLFGSGLSLGAVLIAMVGILWETRKPTAKLTATATLAGSAPKTTRFLITSNTTPNYFAHGTLDCTVAYSITQCGGTSGALETYNDELAAGIASTFNPYLNGTHANIGSHLDNLLVGGDLSVVGDLQPVYADNVFVTDIGWFRKFAALLT